MIKPALSALLAGGLAAAAFTVGPSSVDAADEPTDQLHEVLDDEVTAFQVVEIDVAALAKGLEDGKGTLPTVTEKGELVDLTLAAVPAALRDEGVNVGFLRSPEGVERVPLPPERAYRLGDCPNTDTCATATILDAESTMVSGLVVSPAGTSYYEPVNQLLSTDRYPNLHVVYSDADTLDVVVDDETDMPERDHDLDRESDGRGGGRGAEPGTDLDEPRFVDRRTRIVLDADRTFFNANPATVFSRQLAIFNDFTLLYEFIEPLSSENPETVRWRLDLSVKGQEAWASGGPTTTNKDSLIAELTDPNYFLLNPVTDKEIHLFFVGYDVVGVLGKAAGIGTAAGGLGGAAGRNHVFVEAMTTQTAKSNWVVAAHEVGHIIGGTHGAGVPDTCSNLWLFFATIPICGVSIMADGSAGGPDGRAAYFTDANDAEIGAVLEATLP